MTHLSEPTEGMTKSEPQGEPQTLVNNNVSISAHQMPLVNNNVSILAYQVQLVYLLLQHVNGGTVGQGVEETYEPINIKLLQKEHL